MLGTICNEVFELPGDPQTTTSSPDIEIPETYENSSALFTDQNIGNSDGWLHQGRQKTWRDECQRDQEFIDLTTDDDKNSEIRSPSPAASKIHRTSLLITPVPSSGTLVQPAEPVRPPISSTTPLPHSASPSWISSRRCPWKNAPPVWAINREFFLAEMARSRGSALVISTREGPSFHGDGAIDGKMQESPAVQSNYCGEADPSPDETFASNINTRPGGNITGRSTLGTASRSTSETADSLEIPETPSVTAQSLCPADPAVVRVMGKRLDNGRPGYLVLCWVYPYEGEAVTAELDRRLQDYDEKISSDIARQERLSTLRSQKRFWTMESQDSNQPCKKHKTNASVSTSRNHTHPCRQVQENLFLDSDVCSSFLS